jgi:hypothetical protein
MDTHALVKWCSSEKILINQVEISAISFDKKLGLIEEEFYSVKWTDRKKYRAQLLYLGKILNGILRKTSYLYLQIFSVGNEQQCAMQLDILTVYNEDIEKNSQLKKKIIKNSNEISKQSDKKKLSSQAAIISVDINKVTTVPQKVSSKNNVTKAPSKTSFENSDKRSQDYEAIKLENLHLKTEVCDLRKLIEDRDKLIRNNDFDLEKIKVELSDAKARLAETNDYMGLSFYLNLKILKIVMI